MALTNAQRQFAIQAILATSDFQAVAPIPAGVTLAQLLPGVTVAQVMTAIVTAIGTSVDTELQTAVTNMLALTNAQLATAEAVVTALQAQAAAL
jgi:hypothetical protein